MRALPSSVAAALFCGLSSAPAAAASLSFDVQLYSACEAAVPNSCLEPRFDEIYLQSIYAQLDIGVNFQPTIDLTGQGLVLSRSGGGRIEPFDTLLSLQAFQNDRGRAANTVYALFTDEFDGATVGLAFVDAPPAPYAVVQNIAALRAADLGPGTPAELVASAERLAAAVLAHEIGHVLGGEHGFAPLATQLLTTVMSESLFYDPDFLPSFSAINAAEILASPLLVVTQIAAVPLPASGLMLVGAFGLLVLMRRASLSA